MSIANPLTASSEIQRTALPSRSEKKTQSPLQPNLGIYTKDMVEISKIGLEKQQKETQIEASRSIEDIANEVIRISSTIGRAHSVGNLTNSQATNLYQKIALLL